MEGNATLASAAKPLQPVIVAEEVVKRYGGVVAVDAMSLSIQANEIVGLIGPNGAGKTTMFDCLAGSQGVNAGRITINGSRAEKLPADRRMALGLGRTFQIPRPFSNITLVENVMLGRQRQLGEGILPNWLFSGRVGHEEQTTFEEAMRWLDFVTLARLAHEPARKLSGGQRKLLEIARILMAEPSVILLDEPAAGVNPSFLDIIVERILEIRRSGVAFLVIEHNMDLVARLCDRVIVMANGKQLCEGPPSEVAQNRLVIEAYLGGVVA